jgi:hypothetical protein
MVVDLVVAELDRESSGRGRWSIHSAPSGPAATVRVAGAGDGTGTAAANGRQAGSGGSPGGHVVEHAQRRRGAGHLDQAIAAHQQALNLAEQLSSPLDKAQALAGFGRCALARGQRSEGTTLLRQALDILQQINAGEATEVATELAALA